MLNIENGWVRLARWAFVPAVVVAWLARHGGDALHAVTGLVASVLAVYLAIATPSILLKTIFALLTAVGASGLLLVTDWFWDVAWLRQAHILLVLVWLGMCSIYFGAKLVNRNAQLDALLASVVQRGKRSN